MSMPVSSTNVLSHAPKYHFPPHIRKRKNQDRPIDYMAVDCQNSRVTIFRLGDAKSVFYDAVSYASLWRLADWANAQVKDGKATFEACGSGFVYWMVKP